MKGLGGTFLFTVDGADTDTVNLIRRHLVVALNSFLIMFDAKTDEPDAAMIKPDGGPRVRVGDHGVPRSAGGMGLVGRLVGR